MNQNANISWPGWETVRLIGRGSFGAVYEIQRDVFGDVEKAALKVISIPQNASDVDDMYSDGYDEESITSTFQSHLKGIVAEYSLMRKMNGCPNIVSCDDIRYVQHDDGIGWDIFIKMDLLTPLTKALPAQVSEEAVVKIAKDLCNALAICKEHNVVHRDIKPQNIFVSQYGDYKLGDFGIAKTVEKTMGGTKIGTYKYMAPEVYNNQPYGQSADIYSLGLVLYWLLNERRMPFMPLPPAKLSAGMEEESRLRRFSGEELPAPKNGSEELKRIVLKACAYDPKDRYASVEEMLDDLNGSLIDESARRKQEQEEQERLAKEQAVRAEQERIAREQAARMEQERLRKEQAEQARRVLSEKSAADDHAVTSSFANVSNKTQEPEKTTATRFTVKVNSEEKPEKKNKLGMIAAAVLVLVGMCLVFFSLWNPKPKYTLMEDSCEYSDDMASYPVFCSNYERQQICSITFLDSVKEAPADSWDVSQKQNGTVLAWVKPNGKLYDLYIGANGGVLAPQNCRYLFGGFINLQQISFNGVFDTSKVRDIGWMFYNCHNLMELDVSCFDTSRVVYMDGMFERCSGLIKLDVSGFDTSNVTDIHSMFAHCYNLVNLDVSSFDTANVTNMRWMFLYCGMLTELDVSNFDTAQVTETGGMFEGCSNLTELDVSAFDTSCVTGMSYMFCSCTNLTQLDVSGFDTSCVTDMSYMFYNCPGLFAWNDAQGYFEPLSLNIQNWDLCNVREYENFVYIDDRNISLYGIPWKQFLTNKGAANKIVKVVAGNYQNIALMQDGTVRVSGDNLCGEGDVSAWTELVDVCATGYLSVGLKGDGTVVATGLNDSGQCNVFGWTDIVGIAASEWNVIGLKRDGTAVAVGNNDYGQCNVSGWTNITQVAIGTTHAVGLKADGTVVAVGNNDYGQCNVSGWTDIVSVKVAYTRTIGLKADGTVVATGGNFDGECDVSSWTDIVAIDTDGNHTVGLKSDGTVVAAGFNTWESFNSCAVDNWTDIVYVDVGYYRTIGLTSEGYVIVVGDNGRGQCNIDALN